MRTEVIQVRVSAAEKAHIGKAANDAGMSLSEWTRRRLLAEQQRVVLPTSVGVVERG